jgi:EmrB/QacA subfamily drug resistance transporter
MTSILLKSAPKRRSSDGEPGHGPVLAIVLACYLMIVLDMSVVITALPQIRESLHFSPANLSWVQNGYTLAFGGLLLLGARAGDLLGRRRMFVAGIALFTGASLLAGLAQSPEWLLAARALQGVGGAQAAAAPLAGLMTTFREGPERSRAIGLYSAVAGAGGSVGLVLGGMLTAWASWRWGMLINVPIGLALIWFAPRLLPETEPSTGHFDLPGAVTSTAGMTALVYGFVRAASDGWGERGTVAAFTAAVLLLATFVLTERRAPQPITPLRLFASRERSGAYAARILVVGGMFSMFFFITQFLQGVSGFSALQCGMAFLPLTIVQFGTTRVVPRLEAQLGSTTVLIGGLLVALAGMAWLSRISADAAYFPQVALPMVLLGAGIGAAFTPLTASGMAGVDAADAGAASGLVNVAHQLGGSLGIGSLVTVFAAAGRSASHADARHELAQSVATALTGSALFLALGLAIAVFVMRPAREPAPALAQTVGAR